MMIIASILGGKILQPLMVLTSQWRLLSGAVDAYRQLNRALDAVAERPQTMSLPAPNGALTVEQLTAGFAGRPPVLRGVQFELKPGELLAVVGPSASGKSTLCRLLVGVMAANAGKVRLDGADVYTWNKDELGQYIGYLSQDVELLDGTVEDNVCRFGDPDQTQYQKAVELAGADALIEQLPEREKFQIDDGQSTLSGGERQRLGLARAFYGLPRLLVLDEPNASLDEQAEARLMSALQWFKSQGSMVVLVSHQKRVLQVADKILVLRDGQQLAFGPRDEVLARLSGKAQTKQVVA
jgi:ATP-binding cassette subfamily C exporter for protease/lipase